MSIEYDLSTDDGDDDALNLPSLANNGVPGLVVSVEFDDNLSAPVIENGKVRMPRGGSGGGWTPKPVEFGSGIADPISGVLQGMSFATGIGEIFAKNGEVYFPLAATVDESGNTSPSAVAGAIAGIRYAATSSVSLAEDGSGVGSGVGSSVGPRILPGGIIELPPPSSGTAEVPLARWDEQGGDQVAGLVQLLTLESVYEKPAAYGGQIYFPLAATVDESGKARPSVVAGAIAGIRYAATSSVVPRILHGGIIELPRPDGVLQGLVDDNGDMHTWEQVEGYVGSQVPVAGLQLRLAENFYATFMLNVGIKNGHLSFNFSY